MEDTAFPQSIMELVSGEVVNSADYGLPGLSKRELIALLYATRLLDSDKGLGEAEEDIVLSFRIADKFLEISKK